LRKLSDVHRDDVAVLVVERRES
ncbi:MAG: hypothetical protein QOF21_460, partial [Actinomycetota bacterium]